MAASIIAITSAIFKWKETDLDNTKEGIDSSSGTIHSITVDNSANAAASYLKLYDAASGDVTVGTTAPDWIIKIPASTKRTIPLPEGIAYGTGLTAAVVTAGGTAGTTSPNSDVVVEIIYET